MQIFIMERHDNEDELFIDPRFISHAQHQNQIDIDKNYLPR